MARPVKNYRSGGVSVAMWQNDNGKSFTIQRSYKDQSGQWQNSDFLRFRDLLYLLVLIPQIAADPPKDSGYRRQSGPYGGGSSHNESYGSESYDDGGI